jgi:hypothetical protein
MIIGGFGIAAFVGGVFGAGVFGYIWSAAELANETNDGIGSGASPATLAR